MDLLRRIDLGMGFAVLILPAWTVLRLPSPKVSIPIGSLIFWGWLVLAGDFEMEFDPSYDSFGPGFNLLFGWAFGLGYCAIWAGVRRLLRQSREDRSWSSTSLVVWSALIGLCVCFPFMTVAIYHRSLMFYLPYVLCGVGPILLLCIAMVFSNLLGMRKCNVAPGVRW